MAWNFLQVVEPLAVSDGLYPVPTGEGIGFHLQPGDDSPLTVPITGVKVQRAGDDGAWHPTLNVLTTKGRLFISNGRALVVFDKFMPKDLSSFQPIALVHDDGSTAKKPKWVVTGHVPVRCITQVGARGAIADPKAAKRAKDAINGGLGSVLFGAVDATETTLGERGSAVLVEVILDSGIDPGAVATELLTRVVAERAERADPATQNGWAELVRAGFAPTPGDVHLGDLAGGAAVRSERASHLDDGLIPATDTSPVPRMLMTPAQPSPAIDPRAGAPSVLAPPSPAVARDVGSPPAARLDDPPTVFSTPSVATAPASAAHSAAPSMFDDPPTMAMPALSTSPPSADRAEPAAVNPFDAEPVTGDAFAPPPAPATPPPPAPPGSTKEWLADPTGRYELRYWDGFGWTEHVHANGSQSVDPMR